MELKNVKENLQHTSPFTFLAQNGDEIQQTAQHTLKQRQIMLYPALQAVRHTDPRL